MLVVATIGDATVEVMQGSAGLRYPDRRGSSQAEIGVSRAVSRVEGFEEDLIGFWL
jgi:hypothetical protein